MKHATALFGLAALIPAACNTAPALADTMLVPLCSGDGQVRVVEVPGGKGGSGQEPSPCCLKGCHAGSSRKRLAGQAECGS